MNLRKYGLQAALVAAAMAAIGCRPGPAPAARADGPRPTGLAATASRSADGANLPRGRGLSATPVQLITVSSGPLIAEIQTAGTVTPVTLSPVASQTAGIVSRVLRRAGDWVREGDVVVQLDDSQFKIAVQNAASALESAKINLANGQDLASQSGPKLALQLQAAQSAVASAQKNFDAQEALFKLGGASASQVDSATAQLEQAKANLEEAKTEVDQNQKSDTRTLAQLQLAVDQVANQLAAARLNLKNASIEAPFAGQLAAVNVTPGSFLGQNTPAFVLVSEEREIDFNAPPTDAPALVPGFLLQFTYEGQSYPVRIRQASSAPIGGVVPMVAGVPAASRLPYGAVGTVAYKRTLASGTLVPIAALELVEDKNYVFAIEGGKAKLEPVTIIAESGGTAVVSGVKEGSQLVLNPPPGMLDGTAVQPIGEAKGAEGGGPQKSNP